MPECELNSDWNLPADGVPHISAYKGEVAVQYANIAINTCKDN